MYAFGSICILVDHVPPAVEILCCVSKLSNKGLYKPFSRKRASFDGGANTRTRLISWLHNKSIATLYIVISYFNRVSSMINSDGLHPFGISSLACSAESNSEWNRGFS